MTEDGGSRIEDGELRLHKKDLRYRMENEDLEFKIDGGEPKIEDEQS